MLVKLTQENLQAGLNAVSHVAASRSALPILSSLLIQTEGKAIFLTATNLEVAVSTRVAGKVEKEGRVAVPARLFSDYITSLPGGTISLEKNKKHGLVVEATNGQSTINGADPEEYPSIPKEAEGKSITIKSKDLKKILQQTTIAASQDEARQTLTGVYLYSDDSGSYMVATDSYRLAEKKLPVEASGLDYIIPATTMQEVLRNLPDTEEKTEVVLSANQAVFKIGQTVIISRLIDGKYPDYRQIIPTASEAEAELDKDEFLSIVRVASLFARESAGSIMISLSEQDGQVRVTTVASQAGENTSTATAKVKGDGEVALNARYLIEALQTIDGESVIFKISGKHSPCILRPNEKTPDYTHLIMPLKS